MKLAKSLKIGDTAYSEAEIKRPNTETITTTAELLQDGKRFLALCYFVSNCIETLGDLNTKERIKMLVRDFPIKTLYTLLVQILLYNDSNTENTDDGVEGIYTCPRCFGQVIHELKDGIDTRDHVSDLPIYYDDTPEIDIELVRPFFIPVNKDEKYQITSMILRHPTIGDYIEAEARYGLKSSSKIQLGVYKKCLKSLNGKEIEKAFLNSYGDIIFNNIYPEDMQKIGDNIKNYGMDMNINVKCHKCGKEWKDEINTNNFFAFALRLN